MARPSPLGGCARRPGLKRWAELSFLPKTLHSILLAVLSFLFLSTSAHGQSTTQEDAASGNQGFLHLEHSVHPLTKHAVDAGRVETGKSVNRMLLILSASAEKQSALAKLLEEQQNRTSANFHHWLTPAQFGARFGAETADVQSMRGWLERSGFRVSDVAAGGRWIEFSGTSEQVESAFHTELHYFLLAGKRYVANATDISLPENVARVSRGLVSLNNFPKRLPTQLNGGIAGITANGKKVKLTPALTASGETSTYYVAPGDLAAIYNTKPLLAGGNDGTGIAIAVTGQSQIELTDVQTFRQIFSLKENDPNIFVNGPDPGIAGSIDQQEATLDVEWAGALAPGATIDLVVAATTDSTNGVDLAAAYAIDNAIAPIVTYTYGSCEGSLGTSDGNTFYNSLWQQAAAEGITVLVATGDNGAAACDSPDAGSPATQGFSVNGAATTPYNVAVGGTEFDDIASAATYWNSNNATDYSSALGYIPEKVWNESCDPGQAVGPSNCFLSATNFSTLSGGGGASMIYPKPSWQSGNGVPADGFRDVPDVALAAASGHDEFVYCNSQGGTACQINSQNQVVGLTLVGGTSAATPSMAGILALVEQKNGAYQGQINYTLYKLAQSSGASCDSSAQTNPAGQSSCVFYDITSGSNAVPCAGGSTNCSSSQAGTDGILNGQSATAGYDLATGLGSVNATNLANAWNSVSYAASQTQLQVPTTSFAHGSPVSITGSVAAVSGTGMPTGSVSLETSAYGAADTIAITNGSFSNTKVADLPGGQYILTAHYAGDGTFAPSNSNSVSLSVTPETSTSTLSVGGLTAGSTQYGNPIELIVNVAATSGAGIATGTVTVEDGTTVVGTYPLASNGSATIYTGLGSSFSFSVGSHSLTAAYNGDNSFTPSSSQVMPFTVTKCSPLVVVGVNKSTFSTTEPIGAHVVVSGFGAAAATGNVQFMVDGIAYGPVLPLQAGGFFGAGAQASILITGLSAKSHLVGANYDGSADPNYLSVQYDDPQHEPNDPVVTVTNANGTATTTTLTAQTLPLNLGDTGAFKVNVSPPTATGTVTLWDAVGPRTIAVSLSGGTATIQFPWTQGGTTSLYAVYSGDASDAASSSAPITFPVNRGAVQVGLIAPPQSLRTQQLSLVGSVTGLTSSLKAAGANLETPTGTVEFWDSLNGGTAALLTKQTLTVGAGNIAVYGLRTTLGVGAHALTLHYDGDTNWQPGDSPLAAVNVTEVAGFALTIAPNALAITAGNTGSTNVMIAPSGGFTGTVAVSCTVGPSSPSTNYTCTPAPASINITGATAVTGMLNLTPPATPATSHASTLPFARERSREAATLSVILGSIILFALLAARRTENSKRRLQWAFGSVCVLFCVAGFLDGCGGGGSGGGGGGPVPSKTTLSSSNLHSPYGSTVTFSVNVSATSTPTGTVNLIDNGQLYSSGVVSAGVATFQTTTLPVGVHVLTAQYQGDSQTQASGSAAITQAITGSVTFVVTGTSASTTESGNLTIQVN